MCCLFQLLHLGGIRKAPCLQVFSFQEQLKEVIWKIEIEAIIIISHPLADTMYSSHTLLYFFKLKQLKEQNHTYSGNTFKTFLLSEWKHHALLDIWIFFSFCSKQKCCVFSIAMDCFSCTLSNIQNTQAVHYYIICISMRRTSKWFYLC